MMKIYYDGARCWEKRAIKRLFLLALRHLSQPTNVEIQLSVVDQDTIQQLNRDNRQQDKVTDVLSFPYLSLEAGQIIEDDMDVNMDSGNVMLGDIIICREVAVEQAQQYGHTVKREMCYLALHSLLHLLGYDHMTTQEEYDMTSTASAIMDKARISR